MVRPAQLFEVVVEVVKGMLGIDSIISNVCRFRSWIGNGGGVGCSGDNRHARYLCSREHYYLSLPVTSRQTVLDCIQQRANSR
jgi:hypothetical protein